MGSRMKAFTYIDDKKKFDLAIADSGWLTDMGLFETHWFLDTKWLIKHTTYYNWLTQE